MVRYECLSKILKFAGCCKSLEVSYYSHWDIAGMYYIQNSLVGGRSAYIRADGRKAVWYAKSITSWAIGDVDKMGIVGPHIMYGNCGPNWCTEVIGWEIGTIYSDSTYKSNSK